MKIIDNILKRLKGEEEDLWEGYDPEKPVEPPKILTQEEITEAFKELEKRRQKKPYLQMANQLFIILWTIAHTFILYTMIGSPIHSAILLYVLVNVLIYAHYFILLRKKKDE